MRKVVWVQRERLDMLAAAAEIATIILRRFF